MSSASVEERLSIGSRERIVFCIPAARFSGAERHGGCWPLGEVRAIEGRGAISIICACRFQDPWISSSRQPLGSR